MFDPPPITLGAIMEKLELHPATSPVPIRPPIHYFKLGLWLRAGIASVWVILAGVAMLAETELGPAALGALAAVVGGATIAAYAWQRVIALGAELDAPAEPGASATHDVHADVTAHPPRGAQMRWRALLQR
jgi:hypothetical protein